MTSLFEYTHYRSALNAIVEYRSERGGTQAELARAMNCQAAYFSQVLKGRAELTEDQLIALCEFLELDEKQSDFFLLLLRLSRAGTPKLRAYLQKQIERMIQKSELVEARVPSSEVEANRALGIYYCSSWIPSVLHLATSCESLQTVKALKARFGIDEATIEFHLRELEKFGLVTFEKGRWAYAGSSFHFPRSSPFDLQIQLARRQMVMNSIPFRREADMNYSVVFSADEEAIREIRKQLLKAIEKIHKTFEPAPGADVYSICIDLFKP